ncbi:MAG: heavy-metal-associated domain-containing protein [Sphingobacteriales bacterium]
MKTTIISTIFLFFILGSVSAQKNETVKVWGNCGMCENTIEKAAKAAGATDADWNKETKVLTVSYKGKKTDLSKIEQAIANSGYDTERFTAPDEVYNKLHGCCKYDRKTITTSGAGQKGMDCCKEGKCEKHSTACTDCKNCKEGNGKCTDCCKDGKCTSGKECCKKA